MDKMWVPPQAGGQLGVFTERQALRAGMTYGQIRRRRLAGIWQPVAGKGWALAGQPVTVMHRLMAAWLTWRDGVLVGPSAAQLWAIGGFDQRGLVPLAGYSDVHMAVPSGRTGQPGLVPHHLTVADDDRHTCRDLPVTDFVHACGDTLALAPPGLADSYFAWLVSRQAIKPAELEEACARFRGRKGKARLDRYRAMLESGAASELEWRLQRLLTQAGITGWAANQPVRHRGRIIASADLLFAEAGLIVEADGYLHHGGRENFGRDRRRWRLLQAAGFRVLVFTWDDIVQRPAEVVSQIRQVLEL